MPATGTKAGRELTLRVAGVEKRYGKQVALAGVDLEARRGELVAIVGPNGAGKTTLLSIIAGITTPDAGAAEVDRDEVGWVPQQAALYRRLTVEENLRLFARLEAVDGAEDRVGRMLEQTGLAARRRDQVSTLSGGNQQRINIAIGLLGDPAVLLLDEPSTALDPRQRALLWQFISRLAEEGTTVFFSTHNVGEAERFADRVLVLADGELLFDGPPAEIVAGHRDFEGAFVSFLRDRGH
jgi:ABC-2 type transport system ATP-binding protein